MNFLSIPILIWVLLTLTYTSHIALKISPVEFQTRIEKIVYSYAFGLIILSSYTFTLGAFGILNPWVILVSLIGVNIVISKNGLKAITKYVSKIKIFVGDARNKNAVDAALNEVEVAYYLIHSMRG